MNSIIDKLKKELKGIHEQGLYKNERILLSQQKSEIRVKKIKY